MKVWHVPEWLSEGDHVDVHSGDDKYLDVEREIETRRAYEGRVLLICWEVQDPNKLE